MSNIMKDMRDLIENIENNQLKAKIMKVANQYNTTEVMPVQVFLRDGKPVDHEASGMVNIDRFATMASYKVSEHEKNIIVYGALQTVNADNMEENVDMIKVTIDGVSMTKKSYVNIINKN